MLNSQAAQTLYETARTESEQLWGYELGDEDSYIERKKLALTKGPGYEMYEKCLPTDNVSMLMLRIQNL